MGTINNSQISKDKDEDVKLDDQEQESDAPPKISKKKITKQAVKKNIKPISEEKNISENLILDTLAEEETEGEMPIDTKTTVEDIKNIMVDLLNLK